MTEAERIARAHRAQSAWDEFFAPMIANMREDYSARIAEIARTELNPQRRADGVGILAVALKVIDTLEAGMNEIVRDGDLARAAKVKADEIEKMSDARQRLLKIVGV